MSNRRVAIIASALSTDVREAARIARERDFDGLLLDAWTPTLSIPALSGTGLREFRHMLGSQDQSLVGLQATTGPRGIGRGADIDRLLSRFDQMLRAATELGASIVCLDLGALPAAPFAPPKRRAISSDEAGFIFLPPNNVAPPEPVATEPFADSADPKLVAGVDEAMAAFGAVADRYRLSVALSSSLSGFAALHHVMNKAACPWFGIDLDAVAVARDRWPLDETFSRLGALVRHVRLRDATLGVDGRSRPAVAGQGSVNWPAFFEALDALQYSGWITIDPMELSDRVSAIDAARSVLKQNSADAR